MVCGRRRITNPGEISVKVTPVENISSMSMRVLDIDLDVEDPDEQERITYTGDQLKAGVPWELKARHSYVLLLRTIRNNSSQPGKIKPEIKLGSTTLWDTECVENDDTPETCEWTITVRGA